MVDMTSNQVGASPRTPKSIAPTQWFALRYTDAADPSLPRTVFASESITSDDGTLLQFTFAPAGRTPQVVFEVPVDDVLGCSPHADVRAALAEAFGTAA